MSTQPAEVQDDLEVITDSLERKGWRSREVYRKRGLDLMAQWLLEDPR